MLKKICSKINKELIINSTISGVFASLIIILLKEIFNLNIIKFVNSISYNIFVYLTIFTFIFLVIYFIYQFIKVYIKNKEIFDTYKSYKYSSNWYMLFTEKMIIEELVKRRKLKIFSIDDLDYNLLLDYVNYIEENFCPDDDVMDMLHSTLNKLRNKEFAIKCLNNLLELDFIQKIKNKEKYYKINNDIFKYETSEQIKEDRKYYKQQKKIYRDMEIMRIKQKFISIKSNFIDNLMDIKRKFGERIWRKK